MDYISLYANFLKKLLKPLGSVRGKPMKVVFDCSNGPTALVLKELFRKSKGTHQSRRKVGTPMEASGFINSTLINFKVDGNFPAHGPNPMNEGAMDDLTAAVKKHKADLGVIFDGDGDRAFFMDNRGRPVAADVAITLISGNYIGSAVVNPTIGYLVREFMATAGRKVYDARVGHFFMKQVMVKRKASFGGELSGHYYFNFGSYYADSGIFAALKMINIVSRLDTNLASWIDKLPVYFRSGEVNFKIKDKSAMMKKIEKLYQTRAKKISYLDGIKMEFYDFWFSVRPSNTEDFLRLNLEAKKKTVFDREFAKIKRFIR